MRDSNVYVLSETTAQYYCDGEREYRITRGSDHSAVRVVGSLGYRLWMLESRLVKGCGQVGWRRGKPYLTAQAWTREKQAGIANDLGWDTAEKRLLGSETIAACASADEDAAATARREHEERVLTHVD